MKIRTLILDDDPNSRLAARMALADYPEVEVVSEFEKSGELLAFLEGRTAHLLFLDIELYEKNGIDVGIFIRADMEDYLTHIVYVSSREEYAMQLFKLQPLDFLVKPVSKVQVREVIERSMRQKARSRTLFAYQKGGAFFQAPCDRILYFMSNDKKVILVTEDGKDEFYGKLKDIAAKLPAGFLMIHQSYMINSDYVAQYTYETVTMQDGSILSISKPYRKAVRGRIRELERERLHVVI